MKKSAIIFLIVGGLLVGQNKPSSQPAADEETQKMCVETVLNYQKDLKDGMDNVKQTLQDVQAGKNPNVNGLMASLANLVPIVPPPVRRTGNYVNVKQETPKTKQIKILNQELSAIQKQIGAIKNGNLPIIPLVNMNDLLVGQFGTPLVSYVNQPDRDALGRVIGSTTWQPYVAKTSPFGKVNEVINDNEAEISIKDMTTGDFGGRYLIKYHNNFFHKIAADKGFMLNGIYIVHKEKYHDTDTYVLENVEKQWLLDAAKQIRQKEMKGVNPTSEPATRP
jgi:hypothetical protein